MTPAPPTLQTDNVGFFISGLEDSQLVQLPWKFPLEAWSEHKVSLLQIKSGLSRHVVRFIESGKRRYAIKETTLESAHREFETYTRLIAMEVPTLTPIGVVARNDGTIVVDTFVGKQPQPQMTGYLITELMEKVIPDSLLFRRAFTRENRVRIWDAVIDLFVRMHSRGVYWGDASLANMLIHFSAEQVPELGRRTRLQAVLADAETVEIHPTISDKLRLADVEFFLESMQWTEADLIASGIVRDALITREDRQHFLRTYHEHFTVEQEMQSFELVTHIDVDTLLGNFDVKGYGKLLLQHINEHKWYMSERQKKEVSLVAAAEDWYAEIFKPVCRIFNEYGLPDYFPEKTASSLYVEIMEHKYFMSEREKQDVGLVTAVEDYCAKFALREPHHFTLASILDALRNLLERYTGGSTPVYLA